MSSFPLTNSIIFQDGLLTTNQLNFLYSKEISSAGFCLDEPPYAGNGVFFFCPKIRTKLVGVAGFHGSFSGATLW